MIQSIVLFAFLIITTTVHGQNRVLSLGGASDYVSFTQPIINTDNYTIEAWFLIIGDGDGIDQQNYIYSQRSNETGCFNSSLVFCAKTRPDYPASRLSIRTHEGCGETVEATVAGIGEWHHLAGVKDAGELRLYSDGQLVDSTPYTQTGVITENIATTEIGRHRHDFEDYGYFIGMIDEIRIWDYAITEAEIVSRMNIVLTGEEQGLLAYWNFDDADATDISGNGHNGDFHGDAVTVEAEMFETTQTLWGDLNGDGDRSISDVITLINFILGIND